MKKIVSILAIIALVISVSSCGNKKKKAEVGSHSHEDGTVHADDAHSQDTKSAQESFEVKADDDAEHKHEGGDNDHDGHKHESGDADGEGHNHDKDEHGHENGDETGHDHDSSGDEHSHEQGEHK